MQEVTRRSFLVSAKGGNLDFLSGDGELLYSVFVPAGRQQARDYLDLVPVGGSVQVSDGLVVIEPRLAVAVQHPDGLYESGANPDFKATSASRLETEMRLSISRMQAATARMDAREAALAAVDRVPRGGPALVENDVTVKDE